MNAGFALLADLAVVLALVVAFSCAGTLLGPRSKREGDALEPYETGMRPIASAAPRMSPMFLRYAVLFVVFDVDLAFLLPWALSRPALSLPLAVSAPLFTGLVGFMLVYFWRKGALEC